jgi:hypothetical protein
VNGLRRDLTALLADQHVRRNLGNADRFQWRTRRALAG